MEILPIETYPSPPMGRAVPRERIPEEPPPEERDTEETSRTEEKQPPPEIDEERGQNVDTEA